MPKQNILRQYNVVNKSKIYILVLEIKVTFFSHVTASTKGGEIHRQTKLKGGGVVPMRKKKMNVKHCPKRTFIFPKACHQ